MSRRKFWASEALGKHPGRLTRHGYHPNESEERRHEALHRAAAEHGWGEVSRELNALANANEHRPHLHRVYREDLRYAEEHEIRHRHESRRE